MNLIRIRGVLSPNNIILVNKAFLFSHFSDLSKLKTEFKLVSGPGEKGHHWVSNDLLLDRDKYVYMTNSLSAKANNNFGNKEFTGEVVIEKPSKFLIKSSDSFKSETIGYKEIPDLKLSMALHEGVTDSDLDENFLNKFNLINEHIEAFENEILKLDCEDSELIKEEVREVIRLFNIKDFK